MININDGRNEELPEKCSSLAQYARFVCRMRNALDNIQDKDQRWKAASDVISDSINDGILPDVLQRYRSEVIEMYYWEYDEEAHRWAIEQDAIEKGHEEGFQKGQPGGKDSRKGSRKDSRKDSRRAAERHKEGSRKASRRASITGVCLNRSVWSRKKSGKEKTSPSLWKIWSLMKPGFVLSGMP